MKYKNKCYLLLAAGMLLCSACDDADRNSPEDAPEYGASVQSIINGVKAGANEYPETVSIFLSYGGMSSSMCTGTLIASNYVLTASHCIVNCENDEGTSVEELRPDMRVGIGSSERNFRHVYEIDQFISHPNFVCTPTLIENDIALLRLKKHVPAEVAKPIVPLPPDLAVPISEIDSLDGVDVTHVGFGKIDPNDDMSSGTKYKVNDKVLAVCSRKGTESYYCAHNGYGDLTGGFIYFYYDTVKVGTCQGDSGGPTFIRRGGVPYLYGVTSWGEEGCMGLSATTYVADYYNDFIKKYVGDISHAENCTNKKDDNGDGLVDCDDPLCKYQCTPEDCDNNKDDNGDGYIDCEDKACASQLICVPEDCANGIDDNGNGLTDCDDPRCHRMLRCQPENCTNGKDDNGNYLVDCYDPQCASSPFCRHEDCTNKIDDNDNGLIDCNDPECFVKPICRPEDCSNGIDDNGDGLIDCQDSRCIGTVSCQSEDCLNHIDDNGDGLIDCQDPECQVLDICKPEICNDFVDNNGNGLIDCADPDCLNDYFCQPENCVNHIDDNGNGMVDCEDPSCANNLVCIAEICDDGIDNNGDGKTDCEDADCSDSSACRRGSCSASAAAGHGSFAAVLSALLFGFGLAVRRRRDSLNG